MKTVDQKSVALTREVRRLQESALHTSTTLYLWLRHLRIIKILFSIIPIVLGSLATFQLLTDNSSWSSETSALLAFAAGLLPTLYFTLGFDTHLEKTRALAGEYKNLEIDFRGLAEVGPTKSYTDFEREFERARDRYKRANEQSYTPPQIYFKMAQKQIKAGHYEFDCDEQYKLNQ